jgi:hypothetical protein
VSGWRSACRLLRRHRILAIDDRQRIDGFDKGVISIKYGNEEPLTPGW